jgi:choline monooxygenase
VLLKSDSPASRGLPSAAYRDPKQLELERARIIGASWQLIAHADQLRAHGDYVSLTRHGQPLLLLRDGDTLRGFFNVCRHRAGPLVEGCGRHARLVCRYHGWSYGLDGQLLKAPFMQEDLGPDAAAIRLATVDVAQWGPLVFARTDAGGPSFDAWIESARRGCAAHAIEKMRFLASRTYTVRANWKLYVENYLEGYHIPLVHPGLNRELDFRSYVTEVEGHVVCQRAPLRQGEGARIYNAASEFPDARYYWLYPNLMLNLYQGQLQTNLVEPIDVDTTLVHFDWFVPDPDASAGDASLAEVIRFSDEVQAEDCRIVERVHANIGSRGYAPGPYSSRFERGVARFHELLRAADG